MDSRKSAQQPLRRRPGVPLRRQNSRLFILNFAPESDSFPIFLNFWLPFSLVLNITLETIPPSQAQNNPTVNRRLTTFSCLTCIFTTPQNRLMSSCSTIARTTRPPLMVSLSNHCPPARSVLRFHAKGYDGDEYASRSGTASPARWKRTPRPTRNITPEPPAE